MLNEHHGIKGEDILQEVATRKQPFMGMGDMCPLKEYG
jgi:hypothetical protein